MRWFLGITLLSLAVWGNPTRRLDVPRSAGWFRLHVYPKVLLPIRLARPLRVHQLDGTPLFVRSGDEALFVRQLREWELLFVVRLQLDQQTYIVTATPEEAEPLLQALP